MATSTRTEDIVLDLRSGRVLAQVTASFDRNGHLDPPGQTVHVQVEGIDDFELVADMHGPARDGTELQRALLLELCGWTDPCYTTHRYRNDVPGTSERGPDLISQFETYEPVNRLAPGEIIDIRRGLTGPVVAQLTIHPTGQIIRTPVP